MRKAYVAAALVILLGAAAASQIPAGAPVGLTAKPVPLNAEDPAQTRVGRLAFLGGIALSSPDRRFGGLSGMRFVGDGQLLAISDDGDWLRFRLEERDGRLVGASDLSIGRMVDGDGQPIRGKANADAEALEIEPDGTILVAFEREHRVAAYAPDGSPPRIIAFPDRNWLMKLPGNGGIEAMARVGELRLFLAEETGGADYNLILQSRDRAGSYGRVRFRPPHDYKPTDAVAIGADRVLILNRRYSPLAGVSAVLMELKIDPARLSAAEPRVVAEMVPPVTVDNMEAIAARQQGGRTFIYMASDDNFSPLQRTIVLKFELLP